MDTSAYLAARLALSGPPVLGRPLPPVLFGHVELLARLGSPFAADVTGAAYREPQAGDLYTAIEVLTHAPYYLPSVRRLWWLQLRWRGLTEAARLDACTGVATHVRASLALPRIWSRLGEGEGGDSGCPWLLSLATCQMKWLGVPEAELPHKPVQLVIQQCLAAWADEGRLTLVSPQDDARRAHNRQVRAALASGQRPDVAAIIERLQRKNVAR